MLIVSTHEDEPRVAVCGSGVLLVEPRIVLIDSGLAYCMQVVLAFRDECLFFRNNCLTSNLS